MKKELVPIDEDRLQLAMATLPKLSGISQEAAFIAWLILHGVSMAEIAELHGRVSTTHYRRITTSNAYRHALSKLTPIFLKVVATPLAISRLYRIVLGSNNSVSHQIQASEKLLSFNVELSPQIGALGDKQPGDLTLNEIRAQIAELQDQLDGDMIDVTPNESDQLSDLF